MLILAIFILMTAVALPSVKISSLFLMRLASVSLLLGAGLSYNGLYIQTLGSGIGIYGGLFKVTSVSQYFDTFIYLIGALVLVPWSTHTYRSGYSRKVLYQSVTHLYSAMPTIPSHSLIILFTTCGSSFLISSRDLISMFLSIELQSFGLYILATMYRDSPKATAAGLQYFMLGAISSRLILLGSAFLYAYTGLTNFEAIYSLLYGTHLKIVEAGFIGYALLRIGFFFKSAIAPFHNWAPDVYDGTPTILTRWLTIMPKIAIMIFLLQANPDLISYVLFGGSIVSINIWQNLLLMGSLLSLTIGRVVGLAQYRIKRLLRYSTISHVGFLLLRLGINSEESIQAFLFYLVQYSITNLNTFFVLLAFGYVINVSKSLTDIQYINDLKGQFYSNPLLGLALTISLFSMAGVPPLIGFFGKQMILYSATHRGYYFLSLVAIISSVISASYYLKVIRVIHFESYDKKDDSRVTGRPVLTNVHSFTIATLTMFIALYIFMPSILLNSSTLLALTLFNV